MTRHETYLVHLIKVVFKFQERPYPPLMYANGSRVIEESKSVLLRSTPLCLSPPLRLMLRAPCTCRSSASRGAHRTRATARTRNRRLWSVIQQAVRFSFPFISRRCAYPVPTIFRSAAARIPTGTALQHAHRRERQSSPHAYTQVTCTGAGR
jgi:hypothetical protein